MRKAPYSGDGKGHMFTPEAGSQVLVSYEHGRPGFPVVVGNLFHPQNKQGAKYTTEGNHLKGLQTAGGNKFVMSDKKGEKTILISNSHHKETAIEIGFKKNGHVTIKSKGQVYILSPSITLDAGKEGDIYLHAKNITLDADANLRLFSGVKTEATTEEFELTVSSAATGGATSGTALGGGPTASAKLTSQQVSVSANHVSLASNEMVISGNATTDISGGIVNIN